MNWGKGITLVFIAFAALMITLVYNSYTTKFELVTKNYYSEELIYQQKIDGNTNAGTLSDGLVLSQDSSVVVIHLPSEMKGKKIKGDLWFYFASDSEKDLKLPLVIDSLGRQVIGKALLSKGTYKLMINWANEQQQYYTATEIDVQ